MDCDYVVDAPGYPGARGVSFTEVLLLVRDLGSANGTFVNGRQLDVDSPAALHEGDSLRVWLGLISQLSCEALETFPRPCARDLVHDRR